MRIPLWAVAIVGFAIVILLYIFVSSQFNESTAVEDQAYSGLYIDSITPPVLLSSTEQKRIDQWVKKNNLNKYGDPKGTQYAGAGQPQGLDGAQVNRFQYILSKHSDRPWNNGTDQDEKKLIDAWIKASGLNEFGDSQDTVYSGGTPLFDEATSKAIDKYDYIHQKHPDRPWAKTTQKTP